jgi:hypothetical protein
MAVLEARCDQGRSPAGAADELPMGETRMKKHASERRVFMGAEGVAKSRF